MGIGTTLALTMSSLAGFAKIGWAPSAVGNVVRYDENCRENAPGHGSSAPWAARMAAIALAFITDPTIVSCRCRVRCAERTIQTNTVGKMPLFIPRPVAKRRTTSRPAARTC